METGKGFLTLCKPPPHPGSYWSPCQQPWCPALHYVLFWGSLGSGWLVTAEHREALARPRSDSK